MENRTLNEIHFDECVEKLKKSDEWKKAVAIGRITTRGYPDLGLTLDAIRAVFKESADEIIDKHSARSLRDAAL